MRSDRCGCRKKSKYQGRQFIYPELCPLYQCSSRYQQIVTTYIDCDATYLLQLTFWEKQKSNLFVNTIFLYSHPETRPIANEFTFNDFFKDIKMKDSMSLKNADTGYGITKFI